MDSSKSTMDTQPEHFLKIWIRALALLAGALFLFQTLMDPYLLIDTPRIAGLNARKPAVDTQGRLMRAYDVSRGRPNSVILGSSREAWGMNGNDPVWPMPLRPVYNLAFTDGSPHAAYRYLQHVMASSYPSTAVMGLQFEYFLAWNNLTEHAYGSHLLIRDDGSLANIRLQHLTDVFRYYFSLDGLTDSAVTLWANLNGTLSDMTSTAWISPPIQRSVREIGTGPAFSLYDVTFMRWFRGRNRDTTAMADVKRILDLCKSHNVEVILFISPSHTDELEVLHLTGQWLAYERWKRDLVALTAAYAGGTHLQLWDFSGYGDYTAESPMGSTSSLQWFWNPDHYTQELGKAIVERLFGGGDAKLGVQVTLDNIDSHLVKVRQERLWYLEHHAADERRLTELYSLIH